MYTSICMYIYIDTYVYIYIYIYIYIYAASPSTNSMRQQPSLTVRHETCPETGNVSERLRSCFVSSYSRRGCWRLHLPSTTTTGGA